MSPKRIGILTSGGDCPGLNAVIRGAVKACHQLGYDCVGFLKGYEGLYDPVQYVHLTPQSTRGILNQGGTILGSTNKGRFAATIGVDGRQELDADLVTGVKQTIDQLGIDGLICVGGDGSLAVAQQFYENGIPVVGVPKTIDNDLSATAFTFGFDSAIECATDALDRLHTTAASHERIMVLEVMGRHAGWIALHAGIAGGGDVILIPEIDWNFEHVCHKILHRESQGKNFTLVVVAEGAELPGGGLVGDACDGAQMKLGGLGRAVASEIERRLHRETRLSVLGHLQRGGKPTTFDRVLATQFGAHAVRLVKEGRFGEMICSQPPEMTSVPIVEAVNVLRRVDPHGPAVQAARALGISFGDRPADEIGQDIFDRLEPAAHLVDGHLEPTQAPAIATASAEVDRVEAAAEPATLEVIADATDTLPTEPSKPTQPAEQPTVALEATDTPSEEPRAADKAAAPTESDIAADSPTELDAAEESSPTRAAETASEPSNKTVVLTASDQSATDEAVEDRPAAEESATKAAAARDDEPVAEQPQEETPLEEELVADAVLDLVAEADEAIHGDPLVESDDDAQVDAADAKSDRSGSELEADLSAEADAALEEVLAESDSPDTPVDDPVEPDLPDMTAVQAQLAEKIAAAAKTSRDAAPNSPALEAEEEAEIDVAALVKSKLQAAAANASLEAPLDEPFGDDDPLADARSALEQALSE